MRPLPILLLAGLAAGTTVFAGPDLSKLPPPSTKTDVTYATDIRPIFEVSCFRCHGVDRQKGKIRLDSLEAVLKGGEDGKIVVPGDSTKSQIVIAVARLDPKSAMPPMHKKRGGGDGGPQGAPPTGGPSAADGSAAAGTASPAVVGGPPGAQPPPPPLTPEQVGLVRAWIDQGAK